jgi:hypothetical protein
MLGIYFEHDDRKPVRINHDTPRRRLDEKILVATSDRLKDVA